METLESRLLLTTYGPLIPFTSWNQDGLINSNSSITYNQYAPIDPTTNERSLVGCVATGEAQLLYYWKFPQKISFSAADSYTQDDGLITFDADATKYSFPDFATLTTSLSKINYDFNANEIALLSFAMGIKTQAMYSSTGTGAISKASTFGLVGFESGATKLFTDLSGPDWLAAEPLVIGNIKAGQPVAMSVTDPVNGNHFLLIDGYNDTNDTFHLDLGWGGAEDGWYDLPTFSPGGYTFTTYKLLYNLQPVLAVPTNVQATAGVSDRVSVSWDPSFEAMGYQVWRNTTNDSTTATLISGPNIQTTTYEDTSVVAGRTYYYWVKATSEIGTSKFSTSAMGFRSFVAPATPTNISPVGGITITTLTPTLTSSVFTDGNGKIHVASQWVIQRNTDGAIIFDSGIDTSNLTSLAVANGLLKNSTGYSWKVRYENSAGLWSEYSTPSTFITQDLPLSATFIHRLYNDVLNREPDQAGGAYWAALIESHVYTPTEVASIFVNSEEHRRIMIQEVYQSILHRTADQGGMNGWLAFLNAGHSIEEMKSGFYGSVEYLNNHGGTTAGVIAAYYREILGREGDASGLQSWTRLVNSGVERKIVAYAIMSTSLEGATHLVQQCYRNYLIRDADTAGLNFWVQQVRRGTSSVNIMIGFLGSVEYSLKD